MTFETEGRPCLPVAVALLACSNVTAFGVDQPQPHVAGRDAHRSGDAFGIVGGAGIGLISGFQHSQQLEQDAGSGAAPGAA
jgi:hypothetical protein